MAILVGKEMRILIQGITGRQGRKVVEEMLAAGMKVIAGVTPGKGGQEIAGVPVFHTVKEAMALAPDTSVILVPPLMVLDAAMESMASGIGLIVIVTENVPVKDASIIVEKAALLGCRVVGPSSVGIIAPLKGKLGPIGGADEARMYSPGRVGIVSKSGGMCAETARLLTVEGIGQSTVVGIGGDVIAGSNFVDILTLFQEDKETDAVVLIGEIGGTYEEQAAELLTAGKFKKPLVAFVMGRFAESVQQGLALGHAGAIIENGSGTAQAKKEALRKAGALVATYHDEIPELVRKALRG